MGLFTHGNGRGGAVCNRMAKPANLPRDAPPWERNRILRSLAEADRARLLPRLRAVDLPRGQIVLEAGAPIVQVYFPIRGVVSMVAVFEDGAVAEMATTGIEGAVPAAALLGGERAIARHVVEVPGAALALDAAALQRAMDERRELRTLLHCYVQAFVAQICQSVACNAVHEAEARFARWLLMSQDRAGTGDRVALTHTFIAEMLGVHRQTVTLIVGAFQRAGLIRAERGAIVILDRAGVEQAACECYRAIADEYDRHLPER